jgi:hypothetical protein
LRVEVTGVEIELSSGLRAQVRRRVRLALSRFGPRVHTVLVRLAEPANALGGVDQRCRLRALLDVIGHIDAEAINGGFDAATARAAARLAKRVGFALDGHARAGPLVPSGAGRLPPSGPRRRTRRR